MIDKYSIYLDKLAFSTYSLNGNSSAEVNDKVGGGFMGAGSSDLVRAIAAEKYVQPALRDGKKQIVVAVKDVLRDLVAQGFPATNTPQVCSALRTRKFLHGLGIEIESIEGPPKKQSTTVVYRYRVVDPRGPLESTKPYLKESQPEETPEEWAHRVTGKISGLLKDELAEYGGGEAFIRWVRGYDEEDSL